MIYDIHMTPPDYFCKVMELWQSNISEAGRSSHPHYICYQSRVFGIPRVYLYIRTRKYVWPAQVVNGKYWIKNLCITLQCRSMKYGLYWNMCFIIMWKVATNDKTPYIPHLPWHWGRTDRTGAQKSHPISTYGLSNNGQCMTTSSHNWQYLPLYSIYIYISTHIHTFCETSNQTLLGFSGEDRDSLCSVEVRASLHKWPVTTATGLEHLFLLGLRSEWWSRFVVHKVHLREKWAWVSMLTKWSGILHVHEWIMLGGHPKICKEWKINGLSEQQKIRVIVSEKFLVFIISLL